MPPTSPLELLRSAGEGPQVGPMLIGAAKPAHVLTPTVTVRGIVNMSARRRGRGPGGERRRATVAPWPIWNTSRPTPRDSEEDEVYGVTAELVQPCAACWRPDQTESLAQGHRRAARRRRRRPAGAARRRRPGKIPRSDPPGDRGRDADLSGRGRPRRRHGARSARKEVAQAFTRAGDRRRRRHPGGPGRGGEAGDPRRRAGGGARHPRARA